MYRCFKLTMDLWSFKQNDGQFLDACRKSGSDLKKDLSEAFDSILKNAIDENGVITSTPPEVNAKKEEIKQEEIIISTPKKSDEIPTVQKGRIEFYNTSKGYGFIKNLLGTDKYFFHINNVKSSVAENDIVTFDLERGPKGLNAINVCLENKSGK